MTSLGVEYANFKLQIDRCSVTNNPKPNTLSETLQAWTNTDPSIYACLLIQLCMPVTSAAERSFSVMRMVKTYLRSTMTTEKLSGLYILQEYKETTIDIDKVVECLALKKG
jgi:hypothetical protein